MTAPMTREERLALVRNLRSHRTMCDGGNGNVYDIADDDCEKAADFIEANLSVAQNAPSDAVRRALELARKRIEYFGGITDQRHREANEQYFFPPIDGALADLPPVSSTPSPAVAQQPAFTIDLRSALQLLDSLDRIAEDFRKVQPCRHNNDNVISELKIELAGLREALAAPQQSPRLEREAAHDAIYLRGWNEGVERALERLGEDGWYTPQDAIRPLLETSPIPSTLRVCTDCGQVPACDENCPNAPLPSNHPREVGK